MRLLIVKNKEGKVVSIGVPAPKFANHIGLHPPEGGRVDSVDISSKAQKGRLGIDVMKEIFQTGAFSGKTARRAKK